VVVGVYFFRRDPALVERRMVQDERGEKEKDQKVIMTMMRILGAVMLVVAGLDHRFGWSAVPPALVVAASVVFLAGTALFFAVSLANTYASSIIEIDPRQTVASTGPYRVLRHPMYTAFILMGIATPLVLGSIWSALAQPPAWALLVARILAEERLLSGKLRGYAEYMATTRHRLVPGVW
ncbi:MAG TPA: isoprenylcysteine carboxylmethyltransferase family protein, partial [Polyangiaceae bacterium]